MIIPYFVFTSAIMFSVLIHKRVLILVPFYLYVGMFFSFWVSIIPTTLQFTWVRAFLDLPEKYVSGSFTQRVHSCILRVRFHSWKCD